MWRGGGPPSALLGLLGYYSDIPSHRPNSVLSQYLPRFYSALVVPQGPASGLDLIFRCPGWC